MLKHNFRTHYATNNLNTSGNLVYNDIVALIMLINQNNKNIARRELYENVLRYQNLLLALKYTIYWTYV